MVNGQKAPAGPGCQIGSWPEIGPELGLYARLAQFPNRLRRILKRRFYLIRNLLFRRHARPVAPEQTQALAAVFAPGDWVRVRSQAEIEATLDRWNRLKGCVFMPEMTRFCDSRQRIFKRVEKFLDERDYLIKKANGLYLLEGVLCSGTVDFGPCDRSCFFFWRPEWLIRIDG